VKVLITGGAGFIGSHLADRLLARGDRVAVIDNYATGRRDNLTPQAGLEVVEGSIADPQLVESVLSRFQPERVVHAAASYKDPDNWEEDARTNVQGSAIVARAALRHGVGRLIYFQTALCYGLVPLEQPIKLSHPLRPFESSYAISKTAGESYIALSGVEFLSFRLANAYGPRNLSGPLPTFFHRLSEKKKCFVMDTRRDFIYVQDLIDVVVKAIDGRGNKGYYHISSGSDYAIKELFDETVSALGIRLDQQVEVRPRGADDAFTILLDPSKTSADFQWQIATPLRDGVRAAIDYYRKSGISQTFTHLRLEEKK
jgi:UDP-glucose 4-epimerase